MTVVPARGSEVTKTGRRARIPGLPAQHPVLDPAQALLRLEAGEGDPVQHPIEPAVGYAGDGAGHGARPAIRSAAIQASVASTLAPTMKGQDPADRQRRREIVEARRGAEPDDGEREPERQRADRGDPDEAGEELGRGPAAARLLLVVAEIRAPAAPAPPRARWPPPPPAIATAPVSRSTARKAATEMASAARIICPAAPRRRRGGSPPPGGEALQRIPHEADHGEQGRPDQREHRADGGDPGARPDIGQGCLRREQQWRDQREKDKRVTVHGIVPGCVGV